MKIPIKPLLINVAITLIAASCQKDNSATTTTNAAIQAAVAQTNAIAIAKSTASSGDSVYAVNTCGSFDFVDTVAFNSLPSAIITYLTTNYAGYTALKAFTVNDHSATLTGYVAAINFNGNPVAIKFDANGAFVKVLELREGRDLIGHGFHEGGCFQNRDGRQRDTVALSALPPGVTAYFSSNYSMDTLINALVTREGNFLVISKNVYLFATIFNASGTFVMRVQLPAHDGRINQVAQSALPANILSYLSTTYPNYVFDKAFSININGAIQGYSVVIDANNTKYGLLFDALGNFVKVKIIF